VGAHEEGADTMTKWGEPIDHAALGGTEVARKKQLTTLQARAALIGVELLLLDDGTLLAMKWGWCKPLADAAAASEWLDLIGAPR
jgi:hypothetical protein